MIVSFFGGVIEHTGGEKKFKSAGAANIRALIDELGVCFGEGFRAYLLGGDNCFFLINGQGLMVTGGLDSCLQPGDRVDVLPLIEAG